MILPMARLLRHAAVLRPGPDLRSREGLTTINQVNAPVHLTREGVSIVLAPSLVGDPVAPALGSRPRRPRTGRPGRPRRRASCRGSRTRRWTLRGMRGLLGENAAGFTGLPALEGLRPGRTAGAWAPRVTGWTWTVDDDGPGRDGAAARRRRRGRLGRRADPRADPRGAGAAADLGDQPRRATPLVLAAVRSALPVPGAGRPSCST